MNFSKYYNLEKSEDNSLGLSDSAAPALSLDIRECQTLGESIDQQPTEGTTTTNQWRRTPCYLHLPTQVRSFKIVISISHHGLIQKSYLNIIKV